MKRKQVYFSLFVLVSTALLVYSVVDRYNKELPKELMDYSWQLSMLLDYPFFLFFFGFLPVFLFMVEREFRVKRWFHKVAPPLGFLLFTDSCASKKIVFSWDQVLYIGFVFLLHFGFCCFLWDFSIFER